jgi:hypothetical protein
MGRVLAHELYHILTQSEEHPGSGLAKARFSGQDLMRSRLEFDAVALDRMDASHSAEPVAQTSDGGADYGDSISVGGK